MNILIFGKDGQLGKAFKEILDNRHEKERHQIHFVGRADCDLANSDALVALLNLIRPDLIINAAAYTAVDKAQTEIDVAYSINAKAPQIMAQYAFTNSATLLHYSSDYVFDGSKDGFYSEDDLRNPLSIYGKSKAAGEQAIEESFASQSPKTSARYAILRTSWVYGDGGNFIRTILRLAKEREELKVISNQYGVPTSAEWLAEVSLDLVFGADDEQTRPFPSGIYHAVPSGQTTWHGLATLAVQSAIEVGIALKLKPEAIQPILANNYPLLAPRPMNSRMATNKLRKAILDLPQDAASFYNQHEEVSNFPSWDEIVRRYVYALASEKVN